MIYAAFRSFRTYRDAKRCAYCSREVTLRITGATQNYKNDKPTGVTYYYLWLDDFGRELKGRIRFREKEEPLYSDDTRTSIAALVSEWAPTRPIVLRSDSFPFRT